MWLIGLRTPIDELRQLSEDICLQLPRVIVAHVLLLCCVICFQLIELNYSAHTNSWSAIFTSIPPIPYAFVMETYKAK
jgi:hypothetical protein